MLAQQYMHMMMQYFDEKGEEGDKRLYAKMAYVQIDKDQVFNSEINPGDARRATRSIRRSRHQPIGKDRGDPRDVSDQNEADHQQGHEGHDRLRHLCEGLPRNAHGNKEVQTEREGEKA
jgi:hypothetical protein